MQRRVRVTTTDHRDIFIRPAGFSDRRAMEALGHPPSSLAALCPGRLTRLAWALSGLRAHSLLAVETHTGIPVGSVQFVRTRRDTGTWMFGLWRVSAAHRRLGIGRRLLETGISSLPGLRRLYSFVEWGNEVSIVAHRRLGFEMAEELHGTAILGALSTIGPAAPAARLRPAVAADREHLAGLYGRALGPLWRQLFPAPPGRFALTVGMGSEGPVPGLLSAVRGGPVRLFLAQASATGHDHGFVAIGRRGAPITLYADPERCDPGWLAKIAVQLVAMGTPRDHAIELRGISKDLLGAPGTIRARALMGLADVARFKGSTPVSLSGAPPPPSLREESCAP